jgi:hypothetical protein
MLPEFRKIMIEIMIDQDRSRGLDFIQQVKARIIPTGRCSRIICAIG